MSRPGPPLRRDGTNRQVQNGPRLDAAARYFTRVYPFMRGVGPPHPLTRFTRRATEPGQAERLEWVTDRLEGRGRLQILDAGCGQGTYAVALARRGHLVTGVDFSKPMLRAARRAGERVGVGRRLDLRWADLRSWTPPQTYDVVLCMGVAEYYEEAVRLLLRLYASAGTMLLASMTNVEAGPRNTLRNIWLGLNGLKTGLYRASELHEMLVNQTDAEIRIHETRWTHCVNMRRRSPRPATEVALEEGPVTRAVRSRDELREGADAGGEVGSRAPEGHASSRNGRLRDAERRT